MNSETGIGEFLIRVSGDGDLLERFLDPDTRDQVLKESGLSEAKQEILRSGDDERILSELRDEYPGKDVELFKRPTFSPVIVIVHPSGDR